MKTSGLQACIGIIAGCIAAFALPTPALGQDGGLCPCGFATAVRTRSLSGTEMKCVSEDVDIGNVPPHGIYNKQNQFVSTDRNKKGAIRNTYRFALYEQGLLPAADFGGVVRYGATCSVHKIGKRRARTLEAAYITTAAEYAACASDLSAFVASVTATASNDPVTNCDDQTGDGVVDAWEPLQPVLEQYCFDDSGPIPCPPLQ